MRATPISVIALTGLLSQLSGIVLLAVLFASLRSHARRTTYFRYWNRAWLAILIAIVALCLRISPLPGLTGAPLSMRADASVEIRGLYFVYLTAKLLYFALLAIGARIYARGREGLPSVSLVAVASVSLAAIAVATARVPGAITLWQGVIAVPAFGYCWLLFHRLPRTRQSWGSASLRAVFGGLALLWACYAIGVGYRFWVDADENANPMRLLFEFNTYIDSMFQMLLGYCMVFLLMEDSNRSLADAHAELAAAHDRLRHATLFDPLTGALNRRAFAERLGLQRVFASFGTVAVIDLDGLKPVNDRYGHSVGDALLGHLVAVIAPGLRATDKLFRWGGDEFLVVLPAASVPDATARLSALLTAAPPLLHDGVAIPLEASIGTAAYESADDLEHAVGRADAAMYARKAERRHARGTPPRAPNDALSPDPVVASLPVGATE